MAGSPFGGVRIWYARCPRRYPAVDAEPETPLPLSTVIVVAPGAGERRFTFSPSATAVAFSDDSTSGCVNVEIARVMFSESVVSSFTPSRPSILVWKTRPLGRPYAKSAYERTVRPSTSIPPPWATSTLFVIAFTTFGSAIGAKLSCTCPLNAFTNCCCRATR